MRNYGQVTYSDIVGEQLCLDRSTGYIHLATDAPQKKGDVKHLSLAKSRALATKLAEIAYDVVMTVKLYGGTYAQGHTLSQLRE